MHKSATYGILAAALICGTAAFSSCQKKPEAKAAVVAQELPALTSENIRTVYTDNGRVQMIMTSPLVEQYNNEQYERYEFPKGINVQFFDGNTVQKGSITSHWAHYSDKDRIWKLRDSVVAINNENGAKLETELLYWNQKTEKVWSDRFVKVTEQDQINMGTGFESDQKLEHIKILNYSGTFYVKQQ